MDVAAARTKAYKETNDLLLAPLHEALGELERLFPKKAVISPV
jgi:hypothetical protein